jgi:hypothetical protein
MKQLAIAIAITFATVAGAETLNDLAARLVSSGTVTATGAFSAVGNTIAVNDATGQRALTEGRLPVTVTTDANGSQKLTYVLVLVYDLGQGDESAHLVTTDVRNYTAPAIDPTPFEAAKIAVDAALGAGTWKFVSIESSNAGTIAKIRRNADGVLLAVTLGADGTPITVAAE